MINIHNHSSQDDQSNLLDSYSDQRNDHDTDDNKDQHNNEQQSFLDKVDDILYTDNHKMSKQQILLQAQVVELQMKCNILLQMNKKLMDRLESVNEDSIQQPSNISQKCDESSYFGDMSIMQNQFVEIQSIIGSYRQQLQNYQKLIQEEQQKYVRKLQKLESEISMKNTTIQKIEYELKIAKNDIISLANKNKELLLEIQEMSEERYQTLNQSINKLDNSFDKEVQNQMEAIVEKLALELEYERKIKKKLNLQIHRINKEMENQEKTIQDKNQVIYGLQLKLLHVNDSQKIDNSWVAPRASHKNIHRQERSYDNYNMIKKQFSPKVTKSKQNITVRYSLSQVCNNKSLSAETALIIVWKIIQIYLEIEKQHLIRAKMTMKNLEVQCLSLRDIPSIKVSLNTDRQSVEVVKTAEQYFWSTFTIIQSLIILIQLDAMPSIKKSMQQLSYDSRNRKKMSSFGPLLESIKQIMPISL